MLGTINPEILFLQQEDQIKAGLLDMKMILGITEETYQLLQQSTLTACGQDFTVVTYLSNNPSNPYAKGATAFTLHGTYAVTIEVTLTDASEEDPENLLRDFLAACHFAEE